MPKKKYIDFKMSTKTCLERYKKFEDMFKTVSKRFCLDYVELDLTELIDPVKRLKVDEFLGKSIDWSRVDSKQSYKESGVNH
jgi:hypothetical protein